MTRELSAGTQRTRRNIMKMGAILVPAMLGKADSAAAQPVVCQIPILNLFIPKCDPPPKGGGGGGGANCFLRGNKNPDGRRRTQDRGPGDRRSAADNVRRIASSPMDRPL